MLEIFRGQPEIEIYRGMLVGPGWAGSMGPGGSVGNCWAWAEDGALKGKFTEADYL
jgi:hypothetical protein